MISKAGKLAGVKRPASMEMAQKARELAQSGQNIISLSSGQPHWDTPQPVKDAAWRALEHGETKYTPVDGIPPLKHAIIEKFIRDNDLSYNPSEVIVGAGVKQVISNALAATLDPGDEVLFPTPCWVSYPDIARLCGATPVPIATGPETQFKLTPDQLSSAITPRTKWVILNSPNNPSGAIYTAQELRALAEILLQHEHVAILCDDIYEHFCYTDAPFVTMAQVEPRLKSRTLTCNGVSKAYAMTGWRIGYAGGPDSVISGMRTIQSQTTSAPSSIAQWAAVEALTGDQSFLVTNRELYRSNRDVAVGLLSSVDGMSCQTPDGGFYAYPDISTLIGKSTPGGVRIETDDDFAMQLLLETGVAIVAGSAYGTSPFIRVSFATSQALLKDACQRIAAFCQDLR
ncbi:pyridoxal phosphate-dependent aminotransferase [Shimia abyssi]|uniref:Aminotransferase n=1 Tax=Shimia abyssi TaxID=1662395 RepID=A0A2P8F9T4_9RHOB|nr:pyridoxal phosphate-dependent aminotransferase [Shimia abyssi]PSL18455.1 aspartate aminotransferase [Shimia abyssi]